MTRVDPQRSAVGWQFLDVKDSQSMTRQDFLNGDQRKIREMLMVDGVELVFFHQTNQTWKLECDNAVWMK